MNVDANLKSMQHIATSQQVSANNIANAQSNNFQASRVIQGEDKVTISKEARLAAQNSAGESMSTSNVSQDLMQMTVNETSFTANVKAIQTQDDMDKALFSLKK